MDQENREATFKALRRTSADVKVWFFNNHGHLYPNFSLLIELLMVMLASSAEVERGIGSVVLISSTRCFYVTFLKPVR